MVKNINMFTGKVDIIADSSDSKQAIDYARHQLGKDAGRVIRARQTNTAPPAKDKAQIGLF